MGHNSGDGALYRVHNFRDMGYEVCAISDSDCVSEVLPTLPEESVAMQKTCTVCGRLFETSKYRPNQAVCSDEQCQYRRQLANMKKWRIDNPDYFKTGKDPAAKLKSKMSREEREAYNRNYRVAHKEAHREYMKRYMRLVRKRQRRDHGAF